MKIRLTELCPVCGREIAVDVKEKQQRALVRCDCGSDIAVCTEVKVKTEIFIARLENVSE